MNAPMSLKEMKDELVRMSTELYKAENRVLRPYKDKVLVRVIPKEQRIGLIYTPEKQNKVFLEAVVLDVYAPYWSKYEGYADGIKSVYHEASVKPGDIVLIPHYVGMPDKLLDEKEYRLVPEFEINAIIESVNVLDKLVPFLPDSIVGDAEQTAGTILARFHVIPKRLESRTTSGV
jgi:co-chaperonin GroES (HSP10)